MSECGSQITKSDFFAKCSQQLQQIARNSLIQQEKMRSLKKISQVTAKPPRQDNSLVVKNLLIDYLRLNNMNYTYTTFMREADVLSEEIMKRSELYRKCQLKDNQEFLTRFSALQYLLQANITAQAKGKSVLEIGVQVGGNQERTSMNSSLLLEQRLREVRQEVEEREKKHYNTLLQSIKGQLMLQAKEIAKSSNKLEIEKVRQQCNKRIEESVNESSKLSSGNKAELEGQKAKVRQLQGKIEEMNSRIVQLEKEKLSHNCLLQEAVIDRQVSIQKQRRYLEKKTLELEYALRNMHTRVEDIISQKEKVFDQRPTDHYLTEGRANHSQKNAISEEINKRMALLDHRIELLTADNKLLRQENDRMKPSDSQIIYSHQSNKYYSTESQIVQSEHQKQLNKLKMLPVKPDSRSVSVNVNQNQFRLESLKHIQASIEGEDAEDVINQQIKHRQSVTKIQSEMKMLKNKVRLFVDRFD